MDWDNLRYFLAVARKGSIRAASIDLAVNHSTVTRRISAFEKNLGVRLFERLSGSYLLTATGEEMLKSAQAVEEEIIKLDRQVSGRDSQLHGTLRVTMPPILATHLLMPDISSFTKLYPSINLELAFSNENFDLKKREADVAIRLTSNPPDYLVGREILQPTKGVYGSHEYLANKNLEEIDDFQWIGWEEHASKYNWNELSKYAAAQTTHTADDLLVQLEAVKSGMGLAMLPCFIADTIPNLIRLELLDMHSCGAIWILTHEDLRATARVRVFIDFITKAVDQHLDLVEGRCYQETPGFVTSVA